MEDVLDGLLEEWSVPELDGLVREELELDVLTRVELDDFGREELVLELCLAEDEDPDPSQLPNPFWHPVPRYALDFPQ